MRTAEISAAVDRAFHANAPSVVGALNALARAAARGASTTAAVDDLCRHVAAYLRAKGASNVSAGNVRTALES